jgi:hypothetical protein
MLKGHSRALAQARAAILDHAERDDPRRRQVREHIAARHTSILVAVATAAFAIGVMTGLPGAKASATRTYTLRAGDKVRISTSSR